MRSRKPMTALLALASLPLALTLACGSAAPVTPAPRPTAAKPAATPAPSWTKGEYPKEDAFFGSAATPITATEQEAIDAARDRAMPGIKAELALLNGFVERDHEEQVAEIITRYTTEEFNAIANAVAESCLSSAVVAETWIDESSSPRVLHVLFKLTPEDYYNALFASALPEEQKTRIRNYSTTFTSNVMNNLARR